MRALRSSKCVRAHALPILGPNRLPVTQILCRLYYMYILLEKTAASYSDATIRDFPLSQARVFFNGLASRSVRIRIIISVEKLKF
jgi:hypothetical protein